MRINGALMRRILLTCLVAAGIAGCKGAGILNGDNVLKSQNAIIVNDNALSPNNAIVAVGDPLIFSWFGNNTRPHQVEVTGPNGFDVKSPSQTTGSWSVTFRAAGTYTAKTLDFAASATISVTK
jgi:plastocyanin